MAHFVPSKNKKEFLKNARYVGEKSLKFRPKKPKIRTPKIPQNPTLRAFPGDNRLFRDFRAL